MGIKCAPAFAKAVMTQLFNDLDYVECLIDDLAVFGNCALEEHLVQEVDEVLHHLNKCNFSLKDKKCHFTVQEVINLGHVITPQGNVPQPEKLKAILMVAFPTDAFQWFQFIRIPSCSSYQPTKQK